MDHLPARVSLPGGEVVMGSERHYPEERPVHRREVGPVEIDVAPVTVAAFARFVAATGHVTTAETAPDVRDYPDADPALLVPGSLVFTPPSHPVPLHDVRAWWSWVPGAQWRHPEGPGSSVADRAEHPVTQVSHDDALAYAAWAGLALPTEAEWEHAARGGLVGATYAWGEDDDPAGPHRANRWHGTFPHENLLLDGFARTSPVGAFAPNGYGLLDVCGNVWEWTSDPWTPDHRDAAAGAAPSPPSPAPPAPTASCCSPARPARSGPATHVIKGGSHLCAPSYCLRYRPAARQPQSTDSATSHLGFRCLRRTTNTIDFVQ